jgi:hypothetical protein
MLDADMHHTVMHHSTRHHASYQRFIPFSVLHRNDFDFVFDVFCAYGMLRVTQAFTSECNHCCVCVYATSDGRQAGSLMPYIIAAAELDS